MPHSRFWTLAFLVSAAGISSCSARNGGMRDTGVAVDATSPDASASDAPASDAGECAVDGDCDDGIACTIDDCAAGLCAHPACPDCCADGLVCDVARGCVPAPIACTMHDECDDGVRCTVDRCGDSGFCEIVPESSLCGADEICLPGSGCVPRPPENCATDADCEAGRPCAGVWDCVPEFGCQYVGPRDCADTDPCTVDACVEATGACTHTPAGTGDCACIGVTCDACSTCMAGACVPDADGTSCTDDSMACTLDVCAAGACTHPEVARDCPARACGMSASGCHDCGACPSGEHCDVGRCVPDSTCTPGDTSMSRGTCLSTAPEVQRTCSATELAAPLPTAGRMVFSSTGSDQTFTVPAGVTRIEVKLWGAGGGSYAAGPPGGPGGAGAFVRASLAVTPGEALTIIAGAASPDDGFTRGIVYGGGGEGGYFAADGGGRSAIRRGSMELVTAGGGGAGASCNFGTVCGAGGAGGLDRGQDGEDSPREATDTTYGVAGTGGTTMCGGDGGYTTCGCGLSSGAGQGGAQFLGGSTIGSAPGQGAGGGGGGWMGGGSGGGDCGGNNGGGGGGGSSHVLSAEGCGVAGTGRTAGAASDVDRSGAGDGATSSPGGLSRGASGRVVIAW